MKKLLIYSAITALGFYPTVLFMVLLYKINTTNSFSILGFGFVPIGEKYSLTFDAKILITIPIVFVVALAFFSIIKLIEVIVSCIKNKKTVKNLK